MSGLPGRESTQQAAGEAGCAVVPWTFADHPESEFACVRARDLQEPVVDHAGSFEVGPPFSPEEIRDKSGVGDNATTLLGRILEYGTRPGLYLNGLIRNREPLYIAFQLVPHRFVFHRSAVRPCVIVQVFLVIYKQRGVWVEGPLETTEGHPLVQAV